MPDLRKKLLKRSYGGPRTMDLTAAADYVKRHIQESSYTVKQYNLIVSTLNFWDGITPENVSSSDEDSGKSSPEDDQETVSAGLEALAARAHASILNLSACPDFQQKERVHSIFGFAGCIMKHYDRFVR
ncbi:uncharacterized protein LOC119083109 [Bradysia coprophila]|uniref:uncharacterized protein LOC119083109 n=1 Tax=Bradysia coprophila TaxID=38358 RepID=UPI00187DA341|nr:uncharacterized protein LOC119083109 [Bradysia coprophila]